MLSGMHRIILRMILQCSSNFTLYQEHLVLPFFFLSLKYKLVNLMGNGVKCIVISESNDKSCALFLLLLGKLEILHLSALWYDCSI